jgi:hypothetical protein
MIKIIALLLYLYSGEVTLQQQVAKDVDDCKRIVASETSKLVKNPDFDGGLFAGCVAVKVTEANAK